MRSKVPEDLIIANKGLAAFVELLSIITRNCLRLKNYGRMLTKQVMKSDSEVIGCLVLVVVAFVIGCAANGTMRTACENVPSKPQKVSRIGLSLSPGIANRVTKDLTVTAMPFELGFSLGVVVN